MAALLSYACGVVHRELVILAVVVLVFMVAVLIWHSPPAPMPWHSGHWNESPIATSTP